MTLQGEAAPANAVQQDTDLGREVQGGRKFAAQDVSEDGVGVRVIVNQPQQVRLAHAFSAHQVRDPQCREETETPAGIRRYPGEQIVAS